MLTSPPLPPPPPAAAALKRTRLPDSDASAAHPPPARPDALHSRRAVSPPLSGAAMRKLASPADRTPDGMMRCTQDGDGAGARCCQPGAAAAATRWRLPAAVSAAAAAAAAAAASLAPRAVTRGDIASMPELALPTLRCRTACAREPSRVKSVSHGHHHSCAPGARPHPQRLAERHGAVGTTTGRRMHTQKIPQPARRHGLTSPGHTVQRQQDRAWPHLAHAAHSAAHVVAAHPTAHVAAA